MAQTLTFLRPPPFPKTLRRGGLVTCGPRGNRGPLIRGRTLSTEAILAVQSLKRAAREDNEARVGEVIERSVKRLIKNDVVAAVEELQRQNHCSLALKVFVALRHEFWNPIDYGHCANMVTALARNGMGEEIDGLVKDLIFEGIDGNERQGLAKLVKALIAAEKGEATKVVYQAMKDGGWAGDEYLFKVLSKGLRRLGEGEAADKVDKDYSLWQDQGGRFKTIII